MCRLSVFAQNSVTPSCSIFFGDVAIFFGFSSCASQLRRQRLQPRGVRILFKNNREAFDIRGYGKPNVWCARPWRFCIKQSQQWNAVSATVELSQWINGREYTPCRMENGEQSKTPVSSYQNIFRSIVVLIFDFSVSTVYVSEFVLIAP